MLVLARYRINILDVALPKASADSKRCFDSRESAIGYTWLMFDGELA